MIDSRRRRERADPRGEGPGDGAFRVFGRRFDRLSFRLALGTAFLVLGPLAAGFYALSRHHYEQALDARHRAAELQSRILEVALRHQMIAQDTSLMGDIFAEIGDQPTVRSAMILDHDGEIRIASAKETVGQRIAQDSPTCIVCHAKRGEERDLWTLIEKDDEEVIRTVLPILNRPECHACHDPAERFNGILILDTTLADMKASVGRDLYWFVLGAVFLAVLLLGGMRLLVGSFILKRLGRLSHAARAFAGGDLRMRAAIGGDDVIAVLAGDFDHMAATVSTLIREVKEQEAQLATVMNSLDDGLVVLDRESRVLASNLSFCRRLGTHPEALRGRRCHHSIEGILPCCSASGECPTARCMATGETQRAVFQTPSPSGEDDLVEEVHASPVFDADGQVVQVVEIWRDISERVKEEQRLGEIERLVSLGTLASGFSHEVNTPLASMQTCADAVLGRIDGAGTAALPREEIAAIRASADIIREQVRRCRRITEQFLRFSRGIPPAVEPIDLVEVVTGVIGLTRPTAAEAGVRIEFEAEGRIPAIRANTEVVQHVVLNLLVNAIQSIESGRGRITLRIEGGEEVRILIEDDGCGISPQGRTHLFEPFRSRKPAGTGLGLFLSRSFMRRFGGDVRLLRSEPGHGSCFEVLFSTQAPPPTP